MNENMQQNETTIDLQELFSLLMGKLWLIILVAVLCAGAAFTYEKLTYVPAYTSSATIYIKNTNAGEKVTQSDLNVSATLTSDYEQLITSRTVLETVINNLKLDTSVASLKSSIKITNPTDTRMLYIAVTDYNAETAKKIVDELCSIVSDKIVSIIGAEKVNLVDQGNMPSAPSNSLNKTLIAGAGLLGAAAVCAVILIMMVTDDKIKNIEDIENKLGLTVLGVIPYTEKIETSI